MMKFLVAPPYIRHYERVLGTSLELRIQASTTIQAKTAEVVLFAEIDRLERVFSRFLPDSELNQFLNSNRFQTISSVLRRMLLEAEGWQQRTCGAFHVGTDALVQLWSRAQDNNLPDNLEVAQVLNKLRTPLWNWSADKLQVQRSSDLSLNFHAIAKGFIADQACLVARASMGVSDVLVNIGGDLRHTGAIAAQVLIANPFSRADNAPPITALSLQNQGLASSGGTHRGFSIANRWYSHVFDPRTGQPVSEVVAATVLADDSITADVLATAFSVMTPKESLALCQTLPRVGCFLVTQDGTQHRNSFWQQHEIVPSEQLAQRRTS